MKPRLIHFAFNLACAAGLATINTSFAQPGAGPNGGERPHGPPPEAIAACKNKSSSAVCSFTGREGKQLTGTCFAPPAVDASSSNSGKPGSSAERPMACRPDNANRGPGKG